MLFARQEEAQGVGDWRLGKLCSASISFHWRGESIIWVYFMGECQYGGYWAELLSWAAAKRSFGIVDMRWLAHGRCLNNLPRRGGVLFKGASAKFWFVRYQIGKEIDGLDEAKSRYKQQPTAGVRYENKRRWECCDIIDCSLYLYRISSQDILLYIVTKHQTSPSALVPWYLLWLCWTTWQKLDSLVLSRSCGHSGFNLSIFPCASI